LIKAFAPPPCTCGIFHSVSFTFTPFLACSGLAGALGFCEAVPWRHNAAVKTAYLIVQ
jgi:hypothetical protein